VTPEAEAVLEWEIGEVLRGFQVHVDYDASIDRGFRRYAVWDSRRITSVKISEPAAHAGAQADRVRLQTKAILQLIREHADVRPAD
jgi:hypothetical protein